MALQVILVCTGDACEDVGARDLLKLARATIPGDDFIFGVAEEHHVLASSCG